VEEQQQVAKLKVKPLLIPFRFLAGKPRIIRFF